jgi:multidrug efflux system membrane fusion protein
MSHHYQRDVSPNLGRRKAVAVITLLLVAAVIGGLVFYVNYPAAAIDSTSKAKGGRQGNSEQDEPVAVSIETSTKIDFPLYLNGLGTVTALRSVTVRPRVDGELVNVTFTEGQFVRQGDLLAEIDPRPFSIQLQQAQGQLLRDQALLKNAEIDRARYQTLLEQDSIAAQQTLTQESQVKQYQGTVEMDIAQVNSAKLQLGYARLVAPISGRVGLRQIDQGNIVHANDANGLVVITQLQPITVVFNLPEDKVQAIMKSARSNDAIPIVAYDRGGKNKIAAGQLLAIDNQIDATTGTLKLKAIFDNKELTLFPNQFVNIRMHLETLPAVTVVSSAAIQHDTKGSFVYVATPDKKVQVRRVTLGPTEADRVAILNNLEANETVVVEGFDKLQDGSYVDIAQKDGIAVKADPSLINKTDGKRSKRERRS